VDGSNIAAANSTNDLSQPRKAANSSFLVVKRLIHQIGFVAIAKTVVYLIRGGIVKPFLRSLNLKPLTGVSTVRINASKPESFACLITERLS